MKELEVEVRVRNNRLKERRRALGLSQTMLGKAIGISQNTYSALECMRIKPIDKIGRWTTTARKLAAFYDADLEELFPDAVVDFGKPTSVRQFDHDEFGLLLGQQSQNLLMEQNPEESCQHAELKSKVSEILQTLTPKEADILKSLYGIDNDEMTLTEISKLYNVSSNRIHQIANKALRKLRHPSRSNKLRVFTDGKEVIEARCEICWKNIIAYKNNAVQICNNCGCRAVIGCCIQPNSNICSRCEEYRLSPDNYKMLKALNQKPWLVYESRECLASACGFDWETASAVLANLCNLNYVERSNIRHSALTYQGSLALDRHERLLQSLTPKKKS